MEQKKDKIELKRIGDDLRQGLKSNGIKYTVRDDRRRYFFPKEWNEFIKLTKTEEEKFFFITLIFTGGRVMEVLNLKHEDIDIQRGTIKFKVVKQRKAKRDFDAVGKSRDFFVPSNYIKHYKSFTRGKTINPKEYIFLDNKKLPENYDRLDNKEKKKYYKGKFVTYSQKIKRIMKRTSISDWYNFSPHNFRKTYGMWTRLFINDTGELCYRLGHDIDTYMLHYGSSLIFTDEERREIARIYGSVK